MGEIFKFSAHWLLNDTLNHIILTLHYPEDPEDVSMEMWGWLGRGGQGGVWVVGDVFILLRPLVLSIS